MNYPCCNELGIRTDKGLVKREDLIRELAKASETDPDLPERFHECFGDKPLIAAHVERCLKKVMK